MATTILRPNGPGTYHQVTDDSRFFGAASAWEAVDEVSSDDDTTYIFETAAGIARESFTLDDWSLGAAQISSVVMYAIARRTDATVDSIRLGLYLGGDLEEPGTASFVPSNTYAEFSHVIPRPGGGSWSVSDLNSLEAVVILQENGLGEVRITQTWIVVTYDTVTLPGDPDHPLFTSAIGGPFIVAQSRVVAY